MKSQRNLVGEVKVTNSIRDCSMTRLRKTLGLLAASLGILLLAQSSPLFAAEKTITLKGRVDVSGLNAPRGRFKVRALRPQNRTIELGQADTDGGGRFSLTVEEEDMGVYGVVLQATSEKDPSLVLEAAVLRIREAKEPIPITPVTTVEAAMIHWKVRRHGEDFDPIRPVYLFDWLRPLLRPKAQKGLKRAEVALVKWAHSAAPSGSPTSAAIVQASVGDTRRLKERLTALKVPPKAIDELEKMSRTDPEVAYILMMSYLLEL